MEKMLTRLGRVSKVARRGKKEFILLMVFVGTGAALLLSPWPYSKETLPALTIITACLIFKLLKTDVKI